MIEATATKLFILTFTNDVGGKDPTMRGAHGAEGGNEDTSSALFVLFEHIIKLNLLLQCSMRLRLSLSRSRVGLSRRNRDYKGFNMRAAKMSKLTDLGLNNAPTASPSFPGKNPSTEPVTQPIQRFCSHDIYVGTQEILRMRELMWKNMSLCDHRYIYKKA